MRRIIFTLLALMLLGGVASADRDWRRRGRDTSHHPGGTVVRDHRHHDSYRGDRDRPRYRDYRSYNRVRVDRRPVYVNNGRFVFHGGYTRNYHRPVIRQRYYDYHYRPQIIVENYDPVPGYIWIQGHWHWSGYEWVWTNGYYAPDPNWTEPYYQDSYYDNSSYYDNGSYYDNSYNSGVHIQGSVRLGY